LKENEYEDQLVDDADGEGESPEGRMRSKEGSVGHDGHAEGDPEEHGGQETPPAVVLGVVFERVLDHADVDQTADLFVKSGKTFLNLFQMYLKL
jgi:hypothetical protein